MSGSDPRPEIFARFQAKNLEVKPHAGVVFVCGGKTDVKSIHPVSLRDALLREICKDESRLPPVLMAEHFKDWSEDGVYSDLLTFEQHLAELSSVIVLALESEGALAELGLFTAIEEFQEKVLVFVASAFYEQKSFIRLGPIKFLQDVRKNRPCVDDWMPAPTGGAPKFCPRTATELAAEYVDEIAGRAKPGTVRRQFDSGSWLHKAVLVRELLTLLVALPLREIADYAEKAGVIIPERELKQILYCLEKTDQVVRVERGLQTFYRATSSESRLAVKGGSASFDRGRLVASVSEYYKHTDKRRYRLIRQSIEKDVAP